MRVFRIGVGTHPVWSAMGAYINGGRWNSPQRAVIYGADSFALAMLERLVHTPPDLVPRTDRWVEATVPDGAVEVVDTAVIAGWDADPPKASRDFGDRWLTEARSAALAVPSVVTRIDHNLVLNPTHPRFTEITVGEERPVVWDRRLFAR